MSRQIEAPMEAPHTFGVRNLSVLAYANGFTLWHYKAGRTPIDAVTADGFFIPAEDMFATGDMILVSTSDSAALLCVVPTAGKTLRMA